MLIVLVNIDVLPDHAEDFVAATEINAGESRKESGVVRFDLLREEGQPTRFALLEIYRTDGDQARHKETAHYAAWRTAVEPWMASPRSLVKYRALSPSDAADWQGPR